MTSVYHLIGCASGIAGADSHSGDGPRVMEYSPYLAKLASLGVSYQWASMLSPKADSSLRTEESLGLLFTDLARQVSAFCQHQESFTVIGGDHSCAIGTWSGVRDAYRHQGDIGLIWIDAHMDSHTPETSPSMRIHGMPLACLLGYGYPALTSILHPAPVLKPENVCLIGVRSYETGEAALLKRLNVRIYFMEEVQARGFAAVLQEAVEHVSQHTIGYGITLDMDALDPEDAPAVDVPEAGGIRAEAIRVGFKALANDPALLATELVEFDPLRDQDHKTEKWMAEYVGIFAAGKQSKQV